MFLLSTTALWWYWAGTHTELAQFLFACISGEAWVWLVDGDSASTSNFRYTVAEMSVFVAAGCNPLHIFAFLHQEWFPPGTDHAGNGVDGIVERRIWSSNTKMRIKWSHFVILSPSTDTYVLYTQEMCCTNDVIYNLLVWTSLHTIKVKYQFFINSEIYRQKCEGVVAGRRGTMANKRENGMGAIEWVAA